VFAFVRRKNVGLSVHDEKTDEEEIQAAINKAAALVRETSAIELSEYTSTTDISPWPGRYVIFWEIVNSRYNPSIVQRTPQELFKCVVEPY